MAELRLRTKHKPVPLISIIGEVDHFNVKRAQDGIDELLSEDMNQLVIDFSHTKYVDTAGVAMIFWTAKKLSDRGGRLKLVLPEGDVRRILEIAGVSRLPGTELLTEVNQAVPRKSE